MPICIFNHKSGLFVSACKHSAFFVVKPGFHMIVRIISIVPVVSKKVKTFRTIIWKRYPDDRKRLGRMKRPRSLAKSWVLSGRSGWSCLKRSYGNALRRLRRSGWSKAIPEIITLFPVIKNKFGADGAEAEKIIHKCSQRVWGLFEIRESPWHQVFEEILCLRGTLLASQCRKIKRKSRYQGTRFALRIKIIHLCGLFAKHAQKFYCLTQRHRWQPRVSCLWGDRDDHMETTNRPKSSGSSRNILKRLGWSGRYGRSYGN